MLVHIAMASYPVPKQCFTLCLVEGWALLPRAKRTAAWRNSHAATCNANNKQHTMYIKEVIQSIHICKYMYVQGINALLITIRDHLLVGVGGTSSRTFFHLPCTYHHLTLNYLWKTFLEQILTIYTKKKISSGKKICHPLLYQCRKLKRYLYILYLCLSVTGGDGQLTDTGKEGVEKHRRLHVRKGNGKLQPATCVPSHCLEPATLIQRGAVHHACCYLTSKRSEQIHDLISQTFQFIVGPLK